MLPEKYFGLPKFLTRRYQILQMGGRSPPLPPCLLRLCLYQCLVNLIENMESAKCTIKEAVQAIQEIDFSEDICNTNQYIEKRMQNNDISEIITMERQDISPAVYHMLQNS